MVPYLLNGIPEMDLPPLDPLHFENITISTSSASSLKIDASLINGVMTGLSKVNVVTVSADVDRARYSASLYASHLRIQGQYDVTGKILLFEVDSKGNADVNISMWFTDGFR